MSGNAKSNWMLLLLLARPCLVLPLVGACESDQPNGTGQNAASPVAPVDSGRAVAGTSAPTAGSTAVAGTSAVVTAGARAEARAGTGGAGAPAAAGSTAGTAAVAGSGGSEAAVSGAGGSAGSIASGGAGAPSPDGAGTGGAAAGGSAAPAQPDWSKREDLGKGDGSDVVTIGDSWMDYALGGGGIQAGLDRLGLRYRHYALSGTTLLSGQIPGQYDSAKRANPKIATVIMTGGGNDIMFSGGCDTKEACEKSVMMITEGLNELWTKMAADGVTDVIYIQYSDDAGTTPKDTRPMNSAPAAICLTDKIHCHFLATTEIVMKQLVDGIHPTSAANDRIAKALAMMMEERKMRR